MTNSDRIKAMVDAVGDNDVKASVDAVGGAEANKSLSRIAGNRCAGKCGHSSTYHTVRIKNGDTLDLACAKVDCACMNFVDSGEANQEAR
jgi:hypothetical protein